MIKRHMSLTPALVARAHRVLEDQGPVPGLFHTEEDYDQAVQKILSAHRSGEDRSLASCSVANSRSNAPVQRRRTSGVRCNRLLAALLRGDSKNPRVSVLRSPWDSDPPQDLI
jgi:hypothetical protein